MNKELTQKEMASLGGKARDKALTKQRKIEIARKGGIMRGINHKRKKR